MKEDTKVFLKNLGNGFGKLSLTYGIIGLVLTATPKVVEVVNEVRAAKEVAKNSPLNNLNNK